jgi:hypothetical protein
MQTEKAMVSFAEDGPAAVRSPVILSIKTDQAGHAILRSSDGCMGGTFLNRHAALREVEDRLCMSDQVTVLVIEPEKYRFGK